MKQIPREKIAEICAGVQGEIAVYATVRETGEVFAINEQQQFKAASTIKTPLLALLLHDGETGRLDLNAKRRIAPENFATGSGVLRSLSRDIELSLFDLAVVMIVVSDNTATNEIIDAVGMDRFNETMQQLGFSSTTLGRKLCYSGAKPGENLINAADLGRMTDMAARGELLRPYVSSTLLQIMAGQNLQKLSAPLACIEHKDPHAPLPVPAEGKVVAATKSGTLEVPGISHDSGAFFLPDGSAYTLTVLTKTGDLVAVKEVFAAISRVMYEAMK